MPPPRGPWTWEPRTQRYRDSAGRFLSRREVRGILDTTIANSEAGTEQLANLLRSNLITVSDWEVQMRRLVKDSHISSAALARGGFAHMDAATYGRVGQRVRVQYGYLSDFTRQIQTGEVVLDDGLAARMGMYTEASRGTYHAVERREMMARGFDEEANLLEPGAVHCEGCLAADAAGWVDIGTLPQIGARDCLSRCRCEIRYRMSGTGAEIEMEDETLVGAP